MYKVRIMLDDVAKSSIVLERLTYADAVERFVFYVRCALELGVHIRCVNIIHRNHSIKMFQNH